MGQQIYTWLGPAHKEYLISCYHGIFCSTDDHRKSNVRNQATNYRCQQTKEHTALARESVSLFS